MTVNADDPRPPRVQIADALRESIRAGRLPAGKRLPSVRDLTVEYGVASATAQGAIDILKAEGLAVAHGNRGTFVSDQLPEPEEAEGSPEYVAITRRLESLDEAVRSMAERLQELESEVRSARGQSQ